MMFLNTGMMLAVTVPALPQVGLLSSYMSLYVNSCIGDIVIVTIVIDSRICTGVDVHDLIMCAHVCYY